MYCIFYEAVLYRTNRIYNIKFQSNTSLLTTAPFGEHLFRTQRLRGKRATVVVSYILYLKLSILKKSYSKNQQLAYDFLKESYNDRLEYFSLKNSTITKAVMKSSIIITCTIISVP